MISPLLLVACRNVGSGIQPATPIVDAGDVLVGVPTAMSVELVNVAGRDVEVDSIALAGDGFWHVGSMPIVPEGGSAFLEFSYLPYLPDYDHAVVEIVTDADEAPVYVTLRGRARAPQGAILPPFLDLGTVPVGEEASLPLTVRNDAAREVSLSDGGVPTPFSRDDALPVQIPAGQSAELRVRFTPSDDLPAHAEWSLLLDGSVLGRVRLAGNDCKAGDPTAHDRDDDGVTSCAGDCDDAAEGVAPGRLEAINGADDDCDGRVDEDTTAYDDDGDEQSEEQGDCDDSDALVKVEGSERPDNGIDDDCDGVVDGGAEDADGDGFSVEGGDCAQDDASRHPGAAEIGDGVDQDCDGTVDEGTLARDDDTDGYCEGPTCTGDALPGDCNDAHFFVTPQYEEVASADSYDCEKHPLDAACPNGVDDDCDGHIDEGSAVSDDDGDTYSEYAGDCDDDDPTRGSHALEVPNGVDDDCDGVVDEGTSDRDADGVTEDAGDCDDDNGWMRPGLDEMCGDLLDNDCNGAVDDTCEVLP